MVSGTFESIIPEIPLPDDEVHVAYHDNMTKEGPGAEISERSIKKVSRWFNLNQLQGPAFPADFGGVAQYIGNHIFFAFDHSVRPA